MQRYRSVRTSIHFNRTAPSSYLSPGLGLVLIAAASGLGLAGLPDLAWAADAEPAPTLPLFDWIWEFVNTYQALFGGALGAGVGYLAKWFFDQWSAERTARREFAQSVTTQISELAQKYYWSLANYAGVVAGLLESYLDNRTHHLMLQWDDRKYLDERLDEIAGRFAEMSFYHFCRLIGLFDAFQFQGSNTYLLTSHAAGETAKRLYNTFIGSLPTEDGTDSIDTLKIVKALREERQTDFSEKPLRVCDFPSALFMEEIAKKELKTELENYSNWIKNRVPDVEEAADALRAYNEVLNHELARLYRDFFRKTPPDASLYLGEVAFDEWPNLLTEQSYSAIERASLQSALLKPLGAPISAPEPSAKEKAPEAKPAGAEEPQPQTEDRDTTETDAELGRLLRQLLANSGQAGSADASTGKPPPAGDAGHG